jgi:hypothetical protein
MMYGRLMDLSRRYIHTSRILGERDFGGNGERGCGGNRIWEGWDGVGGKGGIVQRRADAWGEGRKGLG